MHSQPAPETLLADAGQTMADAGSTLAYLQLLIDLLRAAREATEQPVEFGPDEAVLMLEPLHLRLGVVAEGADAVFRGMVRQRVPMQP